MTNALPLFWLFFHKFQKWSDPNRNLNFYYILSTSCPYPGIKRAYKGGGVRGLRFCGSRRFFVRFFDFSRNFAAVFRFIIPTVRGFCPFLCAVFRFLVQNLSVFWFSNIFRFSNQKGDIIFRVLHSFCLTWNACLKRTLIATIISLVRHNYQIKKACPEKYLEACIKKATPAAGCYSQFFVKIVNSLRKISN